MAWTPQPQHQNLRKQARVGAKLQLTEVVFPSPRKNKARSIFHPVGIDQTPTGAHFPCCLWGTGLLADIRQKEYEPARATKNSRAQALPMWNEDTVLGSPGGLEVEKHAKWGSKLCH